MKVIECGGTPREMGRQTGEALREEIRQHLAVKVPVNETWRDRQLPIILDVMRRHLPDVLAEIEGMAEGANLPLLDAYRLNLGAFGDALSAGEGCTNIVFGGGPDGPLWGKNNDGFAREDKQYRPVCARLTRPAKGLPQISFLFCGVIGMSDGMNAEGLAMGHSSVGSVFQQSLHHVPFNLWSYHGRSQCRTTAAFVQHMIAVPLTGKGYSMVCVDRQGVMCSVEAPSPLIQVRRAAGARGMNCVNCYQLSELKEADQRLPEGKAHALGRQVLLEAAVSGDRVLDAACMGELLVYHGKPGICCHGGHDLLHTEFSVIAMAASGRVLLLEGCPCQGAYTEYRL
jgi:hypothetical protein